MEKCLVMQHSLNGRTVELKRAIRKEDMAPGSSGAAYGGGAQSGGAGGPVRGGKQPDWSCPDCKNKNFGWREVCNRCGVSSRQHSLNCLSCSFHRQHLPYGQCD